MSWKRAFDDPIPLARGHQLATLRDAADYILALPAMTSAQEHWQLAMHMLIEAAKSETMAPENRLLRNQRRRWLVLPLPPRDRVCDHFVIARDPLRPGRIERPPAGLPGSGADAKPAGAVQASLGMRSWVDHDDVNAGVAGESDHASRALTAGECHDQVGLSLDEHPLVPNRAGFGAETFPIGHIDVERDTAILCPLNSQRVCSAGTASDHSAERPIGMETIELRINRSAVVEIPAAAYENFRLVWHGAL
ncbi:hypothetical protein V1289_009261 [Bradyrhizobium sp. AZCC 2289]